MALRRLSCIVVALALVALLPSAALALIPFKVSVAELTTYGFQRVGGSVIVTRPINSAEYGFSDGVLNFNIADSGSTTVTIWNQTLGSKSFTFLSDGSGGVSSTEVIVNRRQDGAWFFDYEWATWFICDQVEPPAILMGATRDTARNRLIGDSTTWTGGRLDINREWIWEAANGEVPGLVRQFIHPDGSFTARFYPLEGSGVDWPDVPWYTTNAPNAGVFYFRADFHLTQTLFDSLAAGTYTVRYWLSNGPGQRSNYRTEFLVIQK